MKNKIFSTERIKKIHLLILMMLVFNFYTTAQWSLNLFFNFADGGDSYVTDTLFNKREILVKAGIKQVVVTSSQNKMPPEIVYFNSNGYVEKIKTCVYKKNSNEIAFCNIDSFMYDNLNRVSQMISYSNNGHINIHEFKSYIIIKEANDSFYTEYVNDSMVTYPKDSIHIEKSQQYRTFNNEGHLIKIKRMGMMQLNEFVSEDTFYYGSDNLLDSARGYGGHSIFKKFTEGKNKVIEAVYWFPFPVMNNHENFNNYRWVYNDLGQCVESSITSKQMLRIVSNNKPEYEISKIHVRYYYNQNGTLAKIASDGERVKKQKSSTSYVYYDANGQVIK